jgi:hypothetical protein
MDYGFSGLNKNLNSRLSNSTNLLNSSKLDNLITAVRVKNIILNEFHPRFKELGEWNGLGIIEYEIVNSPTSPGGFLPVAYPLSSNGKIFPLINEIVYVISFPSTGIGTSNAKTKDYYLNTISLWNHPHHNGYPINSSKLPPEQRKDYEQTQAGSVRRVTDQSTEIFLGKTFKERSNIHPLLPFEGDIIQEGRWGNSIRLGSTVGGSPSPTIINNWSETGINGDPITIIRNGQGERTEEGWIPITEDINEDNSSIYLTSTQKIPLEATSTSYTSYNNSTAPNLPNEFSGRQILLNSGRLVFNAGNDHILLSAAKSINLNSQNSVNIDTKDFIVQSRGNVYLGSYSATEPLLKGNLTVNVLQNLITAVKQLNDTFRNLQTQPIVSLGQPVSLDMSMRLASITLNTTLTDIEKQLKDLTSKNNFTI